MIPLSGFNTWGTPHAGFGHRAQFSRAVESRLSVLSPKLSPVGWLGETTLHLSDSTVRLNRWTQDVDPSLKVGSYKYHDLTSYSYKGCPYSWTPNAINQETTRI
jgi:hypothetical protein